MTLFSTSVDLSPGFKTDLKSKASQKFDKI